ncbi:MAG: AAA family ATPase [Anaerolineae bacterium]
MPIYTHCLRTEDHETVGLFVPREEEEKVRGILGAFLDTSGRRRCLLVTGERGIGKSIGVRAAIARLEETRRDFFTLAIPGDQCTTVRHLLITIAETFAQQVRTFFSDDKDLLKEASHLPDLLRTGEMTRGEFYRRGKEIELSTETDYGLVGFIKARLGVKGSLSDERGTDESSTIPVDDDFRARMLAAMLVRVAQKKNRQPLLLVDNLDQIMERDRVEEFMRYVSRLGTLPVVITIRSEFVSADVLREHPQPLRFGPLKPKQLMDILERRLEEDCPDTQALKEGGLFRVAERLAEVTGNPLAFLRWLRYLCWSTSLNPASCFQDLKGYLLAFHETRADEVSRLSQWFFAQGQPFIARSTWREGLALDDEELDYFEERGVLHADDITRPQTKKRYTLSPLLGFLKEM